MDDASGDGSDTSDRTVLSHSDHGDTHVVVPPSPLLSGHKDDFVRGVSTTAHLANIWQFLLGRNALELRRFYTYYFLPAETVTNIAEGTSYRVTKSKLLFDSQQVVAIKHVIPRQMASQGERASSSEHTLETVLRELRILAHKPVRKNVNVAQLIGYGAEEIQGHLAIYLVADFASGGTLKDYLTERSDVSMLERAHFCYDISCGLAGLHTCEIVQGDLKLANVLVFEDNEGFVAKLSDFGCSIFEGDADYTGSWIYNAPEIRRGRSCGFASRVDMYASDVFSLGLVVWETLQGGQPFIDPALEENHLLWLNGLPRDELLLQALQAFELLPIHGLFPRRVLRGVLEGSLRDEPPLRTKCQAIVKLFQTDRIFSNSQRNTSSYFNPSRVPPLRKWSFTRTDGLAATVPVPLQTELFTQLKREINNSTQTTMDSPYFHLAMCHLTGFGTSVSQDNFLESLTRGAGRGEAYSSSLYLRMHLALQTPVDTTLETDHPIVQVEADLQHIPDELYYSHRIRKHEKVLQRVLLNTPFDIHCGTEVLKKNARFKAITIGRTMHADSIVDADTVDAIAMSLRYSSKDKLPLLAISDALDGEGIHQLFHAAARLGLRNIVEMILEAGVDVSSRDDNRATPLIAACRGGHADIVCLLMDHGADPWKRQMDDLSSFHWLMMFEDNEVLSVLEKLRSTHNSMVMDAVVSEPLDLLSHGLRLRWSPVHFAVEARNMTVTKALLGAGASIKAGDTTPLNIAVANHCPEMTKLLLAHGMPSWQRTPFLHIGSVSTFKLLLLHRNHRRQRLYETAREVLKSVYGNINQNDRDGYRPLVKSVRLIPGDIDMAVLDCLLDNGAKLDDDETMTIYCLTAREDGKAGKILDYLIARRAVNITIAFLMRAVMHGNREILDSILATGIDVNARTDENLTPLAAAVLFTKNAYAVQALVDRGADVNAIVEIESDSKSVLELCMALPEGDGQMLDALINGGASVVREDGSTIVFQACSVPAQVNGAHVLRHLLEKHPHLQEYVNVEYNNYTPIHVASFVGNLEAVLILLEHGAEIDTANMFNPIATVEHLARNPEDRFVPFERSGFKLERWKLTAEAVLMKLLDKADPGHGRNQLHIATSICNYDRVVKLVERGVQPWRGDSKKVTPLGLLPNEVFEYDETQNSEPTKDFIVQGLKIKEYLENHMVTWASRVKSLDLIDDPPAPMALETESPFQLETRFKDLVEEKRSDSGEDNPETLAAMSRLAEVYMMQQRWIEAEELLRLVVQKRQKPPKPTERSDCDEARSSLIATLIAMDKLEEARCLVDEALAEAMSKAPCCSDPPEMPSHKTAGSGPRFLDATSSLQEAEVLPLFPALVQLGGSAALDQFIKLCSITEDPGLTIQLFDLCLFMSKWDTAFNGVELMTSAVETIRTNKRCSRPLYIRFYGELIRRYCGLDKRQEAEKELQIILGTLDIIDAEYFPQKYSMLLQVAEVLKHHKRWTKAEEIYQKLFAHSVRHRGRKSYYSTNTSRLIVNISELQLHYKEAGKFQFEFLETYKQVFGPRSTEVQWQRLELARIYEKENRSVECIILQRQALEVFESFGQEGRQNTFEAKTLLCKALTKQQMLDEAENLAREILTECRIIHGEGGSATLAAMNDLALVLNNQNRCEEAIILYRDILEKQEETFGEIHESTRHAMTELLPTYIRANMFEEAESLGKRLVNVSETLHGSESIVTLHVLFYLSGVYEKSGQLEKSRDMKKQVLGLERKLRSPGHTETLYTMTELAQTHYALGEIDEAIMLQLEALQGYRNLEGDNAVKIMGTVFDLACSYHEASKLEDARLQYEEAISMSRSLLGDEDEKTIAKLAPLIALYTEVDEYELAENLAYETLWFMEEAHGDDDPSTQEARRNVIIVVTSLDKWRDAERQSKKLVASLERTHGIDHADTIDAVNRLAECLKEQGKYSAAEPLYNRVLEYNRIHLPSEDNATIEVMTSLVSTLRNLQKYPEAAALNQELLTIQTNTLGPNHATTLDTTAIKATILYAQKRYPEAAALELHILTTRVSTLGPSDPATLEAKHNLAHTYSKQGKHEEAAMLAQDVYKVYEEQGLEDTDEDMLDAIEVLRDIFIAARRWADARGMVDRELIARQIGKKEKGDEGFVAALRCLEVVARGEGDEEEVQEVREMITKEEAAREERTKWVV